MEYPSNEVCIPVAVPNGAAIPHPHITPTLMVANQWQTQMPPPMMHIGPTASKNLTAMAPSTTVDVPHSTAGTLSGSNKGRSKGMSLAFKDLKYTVQAKDPETKKMTPKEILKGCTGYMHSGTLNAIMGSSGGGKTSLLDTLACRKDESLVTGQVLTDGRPRDSATFTHNAGYVIQEDIVMGTLTVRENFLFSARLRLPQEMSEEEKQKRVQDVIDELGLSKVADSRVGDEYVRGISGGERKRVNIGMELITAPTILFLDEPTTGLDSSTSLSVLTLLKSLAEGGRTIILSLHQPRFKIFEMFDSVVIMSEGHIVYQGAPGSCVPYLGSVGYDCPPFNNPADFVLDVVTGEEAPRGEARQRGNLDAEEKKRVRQQTLERLCDAYQKSPMAAEALRHFDLAQAAPASDNSHLRDSFAASWIKQTALCAGRGVKNALRNPATSIGQIAVNLILGVVVGAIYFRIDKHDNTERAIRDRTGCIFFCLVQFMFGRIEGIGAIIPERVIFMHEKASGYYRTSAYYVAKMLADMLPVRVIPTFIFATVVYFMAGFQRDAEKYLVFVAVSVLQTEVATAVVFWLSCSTSMFAVANGLVTMWYVMTMIFSGLLVSITSWPDGTRWIGYLSFCKYSYELLVENEMKGLTFDCTDGGPCTGEEVLGEDNMNISTGQQGLKIMALLIMTAVFFLLGYIQLCRIRRK